MGCLLELFYGRVWPSCRFTASLNSVTVQHKDSLGFVLLKGSFTLSESKVHLNLIIEASSMSPFSIPFKNGFNADLRCCLHVTLKRSKVLRIKTVTLTVRVKKP